MIDNFVPQHYPLECSTDGDTWVLVLGWQKLGDGRISPVATPPIAVRYLQDVRYRPVREHQ